ncbi:vgr related protein [Novosphingobium sp. KCTC 2891]|uniref:vgr related protein n=1 Tax=Novosphingobium sp. KCTC 2891 TaxID=2989730 RepID=UPI0022237D48|nr:vgr related protein [Novosphingobium sp. KCTC 2891]MCW1381660.1 vgr related protein [Novosphingobium sp. KCTC 2891]
MTERPLTAGERMLVQEVFGAAIALDPVRVKRRKFFPLQPKGTVMAPMGHLHFHPQGPHWREDFAQASLPLQALFVHEMVHVWQTQQRGRWWLPLMRHPFCRYGYTYVPDKPFEAYGIEQQAEIVRHVFLAERGLPAPGTPPVEILQRLLPFTNT